MSALRYHLTRQLTQRAGALGAFTAVLLYVGVTAAQAQQPAATTATNIGRVDFDYPGAAKASVEVDLSRDMFGDLFGIGDAALAGVVEALTQSPQAKDGSEAIKQAAAQAGATRELVNIAKDAIHDVRVRVYEGLEQPVEESSSVVAHYDEKLKNAGWESTVRVQDGDDKVRISAIRADGAIKGLFIAAADGNDLVLVNVTCDLSPENAKKLTTAAVKSGLQAGLEKHLEHAMKHMK
jgi:hypothetical protein